MSFPSKMIRPAVGSISLMIVRPSVVLPHPGLAHDAQRLAVANAQVDARNRLHLPDGVLEEPGLDREVLDESLDPEELVPPVRRCCTRRLRRRERSRS